MEIHQPAMFIAGTADGVVMMAAAWKSSVAVAEVVVTGVAMAAATHLAGSLRRMT